MKTRLLVICFYTIFSVGLKAQQATPQLLKEPVAWEFERFALPPVFAPRFPYKGVEELRFSPGMFKKDSADYFTYAFIAQLDNTHTISQTQVQNYLLQYFTGLCAATAKDHKLTIDTTKITVSVEKKKRLPVKEATYTATLHVFGVFADGAPVTLNAEVKVLTNSTANKTYLIFIASPQAKTGTAWGALYRIQKNFKLPPLDF